MHSYVILPIRKVNMLIQICSFLHDALLVVLNIQIDKLTTVAKIISIIKINNIIN